MSFMDVICLILIILGIIYVLSLFVLIALIIRGNIKERLLDGEYNEEEDYDDEIGDESDEDFI